MEHAQAVIIGGGVGGTSIAYHLTELGWRDVILLDRAELTSGSTFHSAGLVGQLRSSTTLTRMMMYGTDMYRRLTAETGVDVSWHEVGSLRLASTKERYEELQRQAGWAKTFGLPLELISPEEAQAKFPLMSLDGVLGAVWLPTDGWLDPSGLAQALAAGARSRGATIRQHTRVVGIEVRDGQVRGVEIESKGGERSTIQADVVVNAGGMFAPEIGRLAGVTVPIIPMAHQYLFTEAIEGAVPSLPTMRDPDRLCYFREEVGGLCMGGYERDPMPWSLDGVPADFNHRLLEPDWPRFQSIMEGAISRVPAIENAGITRMINGPEAFTPDNEFILGESGVRGFFVAAGFCAHGIAGTGGIGQQMAHWIVDGEPELDLWKMDIRRFGGQYRSQKLTLARTYENYATYYDIHYPNEERLAGRPLRLSPAYEDVAALGAVFGEKSMWERPNWFTPNEDGAGVSTREALEALRPRGWAGQHWSPAIGAEALATRQAAAVFDESSFAKIEIEGSGALAFLQRLCANDIDRPVGSITYTQMLNGRGGIECDFTVTRLASDRFLIVTGTAFGNHDLGWIRKHLPARAASGAVESPGADDAADVRVRDVTSARACFGIWGPKAREILQPLTKDDLTNDAFPYLTAREITLGDVPVLALRVTYVGELGWELYCPSEYGRALWQTLWNAGREHGLVAGGYRAIDALRLEKGYRVWSSDITPEETPYEAGLGFAVKADKGEFIGRGALDQARRDGPRKRLRCLVLDDPRSVALGNEPVRVGGAIVGRVTSGGYGFAVERSIAFAYLPPDHATIGTRGEVEVFGEWIGFEIVREPLWDPEGAKNQVVTTQSERRDALAARLFEATLGAFDLLAIQLGLDLGLYDVLRVGAATPGELAGRAGIDVRYAQEWLEQQAVTGILDVDDVAADSASRRFTLPAGHAEALLDPESPAGSQSMPRFVTSGALMLPALVDAYRTGSGVAWDAYPGLILAQELANRPLFRHVLATKWLPAITGVHARLSSPDGARVADVGCGTGYSTIAIATAYPNAVVDGLDIDAESIERARANAAAAGLGEDRVRFHLIDAGRSDLDALYDLVLIVEAVHDMSDPVGVLRAVRRLLAPAGIAIVVDENVADSFTAPGDEIERAMYGYSILFCLPNSRVDAGSAATGTVMRTATLRGYAEAAGFSGVTVLPIAHDVFRLYRLDLPQASSVTVSMFGPDWSASLRRGTDAELRGWVEAALAWCDATDAIAMQHFRRDLQIEQKADRSFVTVADTAVERVLRERIADAYPDHGVVGEEFGTEAGDATTRWYVDPIDGTHNYLRGVPIFGTLLAVEREGELQAAVVSAPAMGGRWYGWRGGGAWARTLGDDAPRRIAVSGISSIDDASVLYTSRPMIDRSGLAPGFDALLGAAWRDRGFGDFWSYMLVAEGAADAMVEVGLKPWDAAAPTLLVEEAGGRVTDLDGRRSVDAPSILATNGPLHEAVRSVLAGREGV